MRPTCPHTQACTSFALAGQVLLGTLLPLVVAARSESAAAIVFARRQGIPASCLRLRACALLHRATSW